MPHRPQGQGQSPGGVETSLYTPPRVPGTAAAAIMRQPPTQAVAAAMYGAVRSAAAGVVTPLVGANKAWLATGASNAALMPSLDSRNKSSDSTDRSMGNASHDATSVATLATESTEEREATASALLMVAKAAEREHYNSMISAAASLASVSTSSTVPLKKRKKQLDSLRRGDENDSMSEATDKEVPASTAAATAEQDPCHVSPVSHSSAEHGLRAESTDDATPTRRIVPPNRGNRTSSYDSKDVPMALKQATPSTTQELLDSAKVHSTAQIGAPQYPEQVLIPHFPTVLHQVLSDKEFDGKVVQWLPDGEAWKVLRWDDVTIRTV